MNYRKLGASGFMVPELSLGTGMFVPEEVFSKNNIDFKLAKRLVDICIERGANMFDSGHTYWNGHSERILGETLKGAAIRRSFRPRSDIGLQVEVPTTSARHGLI